MHPNTWALEGHLATRPLAGNFMGIRALRDLRQLDTQGNQTLEYSGHSATWAVRHFGTQGNLLRGIIYGMSINVFDEL